MGFKVLRRTDVKRGVEVRLRVHRCATLAEIILTDGVGKELMRCLRGRKINGARGRIHSVQQEFNDE